VRYMIAVALLVSALVSSSTATGAAPPRYQLTDLGTLGGSQSVGYGLNNLGQVTGQSYIAGNSHAHAFLYDGAMHDLGALGGPVGGGMLNAYTPYGNFERQLLLNRRENGSAGFAINAHGQVAGMSYFWSEYEGQLYIHSDSVLFDGGIRRVDGNITLPSIGFGINESGQVTGSSNTTWSGNPQAFFYDGILHPLGTLGGTTSVGYGINNGGELTGWATTANDAAQHAYLFRLFDYSMHDLGTLGGIHSVGTSINDNEWVAGWSSTANEAAHHAFLYYSDTMHDLGTIGGAESEGWSINAYGQVTGWSNPVGSDAMHAFVYDPGFGMVDLNSLIDPATGWVLTRGNAINSLGQITGYGIHPGGQVRAFLLTPIPVPAVPEPSSVILAMMACGGLWVLRRKLN